MVFVSNSGWVITMRGGGSLQGEGKGVHQPTQGGLRLCGMQVLYLEFEEH